MESFYLIIVVVLFALAISDLVVGVSNDAVNFLNSAVGAKAASFRTIMIVAALGILVGTTFSSGLMEVARKGIFHPDQFYFSEIMIIFLAVMLTDIILLDAFNTWGLPTSTTVSIVFELLGASVAVALVKMANSTEIAQSLSTYINFTKAIGIISGILVSIVIAFSVGTIVQWLTRLIFSFNYQKNLKYFGAIWGGLAITAITYFMLIKGAKGASFITEENLKWISTHTFEILGISFIGWTVVFQLLNSLINFNILRLVVLVGTFALAMAFAGNDLVNFIGVPLAGFESYKEFIANPGADPNSLLMVALTGKIKTPTMYLLIAGIVMVITLWTSRKARTVMNTEINLARQGEGAERFGSTYFSRSIVRSTRNVHGAIHNIIPASVKAKIDRQFDHTLAPSINTADKSVKFDMIRASVNLVVASILIALGTSLKLPLSTTYVTFMVAMGTSLSDRAWGRESAVYRITGVLSVVGGWFFTAFSAFTAAFLVAWLIHWGGMIAIAILLLLAILILIRTRIIHHRRKLENERKEQQEELIMEMHDDDIIQNCTSDILEILREILETYNRMFEGLTHESLKDLRKANKNIKSINLKSKELKDNLNKTVNKLKEDEIETGYFYVQVLDYLREMVHCVSFISKPSLEHISNNLKPLTKEQVVELNRIKDELNDLLNSIIQVITESNYRDFSIILQKQQGLLEIIQNSNRNQIKRIKNALSGTRTSLLYLNILTETKNLLLYAVNLLKSHRDFVQYHNNNKRE